MTAKILPLAPTLRHGARMYRIAAGGVEERAARDWQPVTLTTLRLRHATGSAVWAWLASHGFRRRSSGASGEHKTARVSAQLTPATVEAADALAERWGTSRGKAIERAVVAAVKSDA